MKSLQDRDCTLCKLHKTAEFVCLYGQGPQPCDIMIIGEAPGKREDGHGRPFVGRSGKLLEASLAEIGIRRQDVYISNAVHCRPPENRKPSKAEIKICKRYLDDEIRRVNPKFILTLGNTPLESLTGSGGIKKRRGKPFELDGRVIVPTYHPAAVLYDPTNEYHFKRDLEKFREVVAFGGIPYEKAVDYVVVDTWSKVEDMLEALRGTVSSDCETSGLYPWAEDAHIVTVGFGTRDKQWILPCKSSSWDMPWSKTEMVSILDRVAERLEHCVLVGHNWKFDRLWLRVTYGVDIRADFDTMLAHYAIDENKRHGLDTLAQFYFGAPDWDVPLKLKQGLEGKFSDHCLYLAQDLYYTRKLRFRLQKEFDKDWKTERIFKRIIMPCADLFSQVEWRGVYIDVGKFDVAEAYLKEEMAKAEKELKKYGDINWGSPKQVGDLLYGKLKIKCPEKTKKGSNSTSESALKQIDHPCVAALLKFRGAKQQLSFFIEGWKPYLVNGRLHPSFKLHGTVTGRLSCENPNLQQVPRDPRIRTLITAPEGWTLLEADLSQIELRIAAELSGDPELVYCFSHEVDVHWRTMINSVNSDAGGYAKDVIKTVELYCLQRGLSADRTSTEVLSRVWEEIKTGEKPQEWLQSCFKDGEDKEAWCREWGKSGERVERLMERRNPTLASEKVPQGLLRKLQEYAAHIASSHKRRPGRLEPIKLSHALPLMSRIGPSIATELHTVWKEGRKKAKAVNFGFVFGMWWKKFKIYARDNYDVKLTDSEAMKAREDFFKLYRSLEGWQRAQKRFAHENGYVESLAGRKRRLLDAMLYDDTPSRAEAQRQAINSPVQSFANELNLMAALQLREEFPTNVLYIVGTVHDAILIEVKNEYVEQVYTRLLEIMSWPKMLDEFEIEFGVPIEAEAKLGPWAGGVNIKKWLAANESIEQKRWRA
jgi:uracil-DNA glycosylase family 4